MDDLQASRTRVESRARGKIRVMRLAPHLELDRQHARRANSDVASPPADSPEIANGHYDRRSNFQHPPSDQLVATVSKTSLELEEVPVDGSSSCGKPLTRQ